MVAYRNHEISKESEKKKEKKTGGVKPNRRKAFITKALSRNISGEEKSI
jgi:hypothetical protein